MSKSTLLALCLFFALLVAGLARAVVRADRPGGQGQGADRVKSPFPYFGGKSRAANLAWPRSGVVELVEPFFGSGAMLLARPDGWTGTRP